MSKTLKEMAQLLRGSNEELFDRYINVRLCRTKPEPSGGFSIFGGTSLSKAWDVLKGNTKISDLDFQIVCPRTGQKPNITVSGQWSATNVVNQVTITIYNMDANIDTMAYNYAEVDVGYYNSGIHISFIGKITNCYMAKPNPNGELVIIVTTAAVNDLYAQGDFEVEFSQDTVDTQTLVLTCVNAMCTKYPSLRPYCTDVATTIPAVWTSQTYTVGKGTRHFRSCMECITWLNSLFTTFTLGTGFASAGLTSAGGAVRNLISTSAKDLTSSLPPLRLSFDHGGNLLCRCSYSNATPTSVKALYAIGSATLTSENATVTAPFNPGLLPGEVVYISAKYFRTRVNIDAVRDAYKNMGDLWYIVNTQFTFSTFTANNMSLLLNNIKNKVSAKDG
jgi:hypothetical protein